MFNIPSYKIRNNIRPVLSVMASQHELPATAALFNSARKMVFSAEVYSVYNMYDSEEYGIYIPSLWAGFVASPNLSLFVQMGSGKMQDDNITTFGPVLNFIWGQEAKETVLNIAINHLKGPDHFRVKDISMSLLKKVNLGDNRFVYGISPHYMNAKVKIKDRDIVGERNINKTINETIYHYRAGFYRNINAIDLGVELNLSKNTLITKFNLVFII